MFLSHDECLLGSSLRGEVPFGEVVRMHKVPGIFQTMLAQERGDDENYRFMATIMDTVFQQLRYAKVHLTDYATNLCTQDGGFWRPYIPVSRCHSWTQDDIAVLNPWWGVSPRFHLRAVL